MKLWLGIDPGSVSGAISLIKEEEGLLCKDCNGKTPSEVWSNFQDEFTLVPFEPLTIQGAAIERVSAFPKQGVSSVFSFGTNYGAWQGFLLALGIPFELVSPRSWQKAVLGSAGSTGDGSLVYCQRKYPAEKWTRKKDHNRADARCLSEWARTRFS